MVRSEKDVDQGYIDVRRAGGEPAPPLLGADFSHHGATRAFPVLSSSLKKHR